jgi:gluconolactonase
MHNSLAATLLVIVLWFQTNAIVKLDPALDQILPPGATLEKLGDGFVFLEGPVWVRNGGYLLFSNMPEGNISRWSPDGKISPVVDLTKFIKSSDAASSENYLSNGLTFDREGRLVYCSQIGHAIMRIEKDGKHTILVDNFEGKPLSRPNDLVFKSNGSLYFTDNGREPGALPSSAYLLKDGKLQIVTRDLASPNGIALSPDEKYLYVNDISKKTVWRFDVLRDDTVTNRKLFIDMNSVPGDGGPDGMKVDKRGNVYDSGPGGLWILSPEGKPLGRISTPDRVSNLAFGDADGKGLYITLHNALYRIRVNVEGVRP